MIFNFAGESASGEVDGVQVSTEVPDVAVITNAFTIGRQFTDSFAAEFRLGLFNNLEFADFEKEDAKLTINELTASPEYDVDVDRFLGGYLRFGDFVTDSFYPYAIVGYTQMKATAELGNATFFDESGQATDLTFPKTKSTESASSSSFGFGFIAELDGSSYFGVEYMTYFNDDDDLGDVSGWTIRFGSSF